jgi:hypothetical protein
MLAFCGVAAAQTTLLIRSDTACALVVNGTAQGQLAANSTKPVKVGAGDQYIECKASNGAQVDSTLSVEGGVQKLVQLSLAAKMNAINSGLDKRYSAPGDGTVVDSQTDLVWAQQDNGHHITWNEAQSYCSSLGTAGGGWRLPSMNELAGLYDASRTLRTQCGPHHICHAPSQLRLTLYGHWSSERRGSSRAWIFFLHAGSRDLDTISYIDSDLSSYPAEHLALCVRRRS